MFNRIVFTIAVMCFGSLAATADEFTVVNSSKQDKYVIVRYFVPENYGSGFLKSIDPAKWVTVGYYRVPVGETMTVYRGPNPKILVRIHTAGNFNNVSIPQFHDGEEEHWVHPIKAFETQQLIGDDKVQFSLEGKPVDNPAKDGFKVVKGFFVMKAHTKLTLR